MSVLMSDAERAWLAEVGMRVRLARVVARETQREVAARAGLTTTTVGQLERGEHAAGVTVYRRVAGALNVTLPWLLAGPDDQLTRPTPGRP